MPSQNHLICSSKIRNCFEVKPRTGRPLATVVLGIAVLPQNKKIQIEQTRHRWHVKTQSVTRKLGDLYHAFDRVMQEGKLFGKNVKVSKSHLIVKKGFSLNFAKSFFWTNINDADEPRILCSVNGNEKSCNLYTGDKADDYNKKCMNLSQ